ncbi:hypothetical protein [Streptomyces sp. NPDC059761]|uniref:hypothetical protein n=1 Tax=Streptomyces sp. NPDC059761 TaxID=3346937 RepID=UPI00365E9F2B
MSNDARAKAANLARDIWLGIWPHIEMSADPHRRWREDQHPDPSFCLTAFTPGDDAKPGDVFLVLTVDQDDLRYSGILRTHTAREAVRSNDGHLFLVEHVTSKTIRGYEMMPPRGGYGGSDLDAFGNVRKGADSTSYKLGASSRLLARLGTLDEIRGKLTGHPFYADWQAAHDKALAEHEEATALREAQEAEHEKEWAPRRAAVAALKELTGEPLVRIGGWRDERVEHESGWLAEGDRLMIYLAGLNAVGRLDDDQHSAALGHLRTLGLNTTVKES